MLRSEKDKLFEKITKWVGERLEKLTGPEGKYKSREIAEISKVAGSRLTEIKRYPKYKKLIGEKDFLRLVSSEIMEVKDIMEDLEAGGVLDQKEKEYLELMKLYGLKGFRRRAMAVIRLGGDLEKILDQWLLDNIK